MLTLCLFYSVSAEKTDSEKEMNLICEIEKKPKGNSIGGKSFSDLVWILLSGRGGAP